MKPGNIHVWIVTHVKWYRQRGFHEKESRLKRNTFNKELRERIWTICLPYHFPSVRPGSGAGPYIFSVGPYDEAGHTLDLERAWHTLKVGPLYDDLRDGKHFPLMLLPPERRFVVYEHYFDHSKFDIRTRCNRQAGRALLEAREQGSKLLPRRFGLSWVLALTRTSHAVRKESLPFFYRLNALHIKRPTELKILLKDIFRRLPPQPDRHIAHLVFTIRPDMHGAGEVFKNLAYLHSLRTVRITEPITGVDLSNERAINAAMKNNAGLRELAKLRGLQSISLSAANTFMEQWLNARLTRAR